MLSSSASAQQAAEHRDQRDSVLSSNPLAISIKIDRKGGHLYRSFSSLQREPVREIVRSRKRFNEVWGAVNWPMPKVDFRHEMVVVAGIGFQANTADMVSIDEIVRTPDAWFVVVSNYDVDPNCGVAATTSAPLDIVRLPRTDRPVRFIERQRRSPDCGVRFPLDGDEIRRKARKPK